MSIKRRIFTRKFKQQVPREVQAGKSLPLVLYGAASAFKVWPRGTRPVLRAAVTGLLAAALVQSYWRAPDF